MKELARNLRRSQTEAEKKIWFFLKNRQFLNCKFRRQYPIPPYIVDFCCIEKKLVIEIDGGQHNQRSIDEDRRTDFLNKKGYRILRFWNHHVLQEIDSIQEVIRRALDSPSP